MLAANGSQSWMLTEPWAILISGMATLAAALIIALVGPWLLGKRFQTLDDAANEAKRAASNVQERIGVLDTQVAALEASLARVQNLLSDLTDGLDRARRAREDLPPGAPPPVAPNGDWEQLRSHWNDVREKVEALASEPGTDGRTRARYSRIDRRNYRRLLEALAADNQLGGRAAEYLEAFDIWARYRTNRAPIPQAELERLSFIRDQLVAH